MTEQLPESPTIMADGHSDATSHEPPTSIAIPGWHCIANAVIRAYGEEGPVDLLALKAGRGAALVGFLEPGQEASAEEAAEAFRTMLRDLGFEQRFPGELPVVALAVPRESASALAQTIEAAFASTPWPSLPAGWVEWIVERLDPAARPAPAPTREAAARASEFLPPLETPAAAPIPAALPLTDMPGARSSWLDWGASLGFAAGIMLALLLGLAVVWQGARLF